MQGKQAALAHQQEMDYTNSVLHEIQRYINLVSINLPHATTEHVNFQGEFLFNLSHTIGFLVAWKVNQLNIIYIVIMESTTLKHFTAKRHTIERFQSMQLRRHTPVLLLDYLYL